MNLMNGRDFALAMSMLVLICLNGSAFAQTDGQNTAQLDQRPDLTTDLQDPAVELRNIRERRLLIRTPSDSLFRTSPLTPIREATIAAERGLYERTDIKFGASGNHLLQGLTDERPNTDDYGMSSFFIFTGTWDGYRKGCPNQGEITTSIEGRWNYGPPDPVTLGAQGLGTTLFTANPFTTYNPAFLVRNMFWRQGSREAGWRYRIGRVTPDQFLASSRHITPLDTFLPIGSGAFAIALPDSGFGWIGGFYLNDWLNVAGAIHDANAARTDLGELSQGDLFKAVEIQAKLYPLTDNAGYSKLTLWHNDGTADGNAINGSTGQDGWGFFLKLEQELTSDGRVIGVGRFGRSYMDSAVYSKLAGGHMVIYDPLCSGRYDRMGFHADAIGIGSNWGLQTGALREETDIEMFYRFPLLPEMDMTFAYQAIFNPGLDPNNDFGSAISLRFRSTW